MLIGLLNPPYVIGWPVGKSQSVDTCTSMLRQQKQTSDYFNQQSIEVRRPLTNKSKYILDAKRLQEGFT